MSEAKSGIYLQVSIDRLAADVASIKAKVDAVAPDDVRHFVESEKAWVAHVTEQRDAAIRECDTARAEVERLRGDVERLRMQLAVCGVLADCNTTDSLERNRRMHPDYDCASVQSVIRAVGREIALRAEVERLRAELPARQPAGNSGETPDSSPAAPQLAGQGISPGLQEKQSAGNAAPAAGWLTERERTVLELIAMERRTDSDLHWFNDVLPAIRSILARAGSPPVVVLPTVFARSLLGDELVALQQVKDALDKAGVAWKEVGRE